MDKILRSNQAEFLALYGRRRVGKTFLIRQHLKDKLEEIESEITMDKLFER